MNNFGKFLGFPEFLVHNVCQFQFLSHDYPILTLQHIVCDVHLKLILIEEGYFDQS